MTRALIALSLLLGSCDPAPPPETEPPPPPPGLDGGLEAVDCATAILVELGRCVGADGAPCDGTEPRPRWDAMPAAGVLAPLVGPQGATMFALAARAQGIEPGDLDRPASRANPVVSLALLDDGGDELSRLSSRSPFAPSEGLADTWESAQLFVVVDHLPRELRGRSLRAEATLADRDGRLGCGSLRFSTPP